jgi:hypothetical protein
VRVTAQFDFPAPPNTVARLFATHDFVLAAAGPDSQASVKGDPDGAFTVTVRSPLPSSAIPPKAQALVQGQLEMRQAMAWEEPLPDGERRASVAGEVAGAPVVLDGHVALTPTRGEGSHLIFEGEVKAQLPLFGRIIEEAAVPAILSALRAQHAEAVRCLSA